MSNSNITPRPEKNYNTLIVILTVAIVAIVAILFFLPEYKGTVGMDVTIFPLANAILNFFTLAFLIMAIITIKRGNVQLHKLFIILAFVTTTLFLLSYVTYHFLTASTSYGGESFLKYVYYFILITHILCAIANIPLALVALAHGFNDKIDKHKRIVKWTMPVWLYVSATGIIVYFMISPYY
jgi:putative membrane protein